jgi:hypothetical protein
MLSELQNWIEMLLSMAYRAKAAAARSEGTRRANHFALSEIMSRPVDKNNPLPFFRNSCLLSAHPASHEGRIAIVTDVGSGMRWTREGSARGERADESILADGQVAWS